MSLFRFLKDNNAIAAVEFALIVPALLALFLGGFETTRYVLLHQKLSKTTSTMSDLISRLPSVTETEITNSFNAVQHLMEPYYDPANIVIVISSVLNDGTDTEVNWQRCGGGTPIVVSAIGTEGNAATLPNGLVLDTDEDVIVAEVFYNFSPVVAADIFGAQTIYKVRVTKPRLGALITIADNGGVTGCT